MTRARGFIAGVGLVLAATAVTAMLGVWQVSSERATASARPDWKEVKWPFPIDQWGTGTAFRCKAADCGADIIVYLRPKIGFCNCTTGVADDAELERVADLTLFEQAFSPLGNGRTIKVGPMAGRSRLYGMARGTPRKVLAMAFNERCDAIAATAVVTHTEPAAFEGTVLAFLNGETVMRWAELKLGL